MSFRKFKLMSRRERLALLADHFYKKYLTARVKLISKQVGEPPNSSQLFALSHSLLGYYFAPFSDDLEYFREPIPGQNYNKGEEFIMFTKSAYPYVYGITEKDSTREIVGLAAIIRDYFTRYPLDELDHYLLNGDFRDKKLSQVADEAPGINGRIADENDVQKRIRRHFF